MATGKRLAEIAMLVAMPATVGLGLWGSLELLGFGAPIPEPTLEDSGIAQTGRISKLTIVLEHPANGQAGAPTVVDQYKVRDGLPVSNLKSGDKVAFTAAQVGGVWTVVKIQKQ